MKRFISKFTDFNKFEFGAATTILVLAMINLSSKVESGIVNLWDEGFLLELFHALFLYMLFLFLNFYIIPALVRRESVVRNIFIIVATIIICELIFSEITVIITLCFALYTVVKYVGLYIYTNPEVVKTKFNQLFLKITIAGILWLLITLLLASGDADGEIIIGWTIFCITGVSIYFLSFRFLILKCLEKKRPFITYLIRIFLFLALSIIPVAFIVTLITDHEEVGFAVAFINASLHLFITAPIIWALFKRHMKGKEELFMLKKELGQSTANFDFLRSQINPHFLFNALNTLYGTALQEKADRTGEGIQKLGDMMRFMLHENMQEKISLVREIEYLNNYIDLQRLRTDPNPNVVINIKIEENEAYNIQVAPMLLIPFVENAFKHGISFREPSPINITLEMTEKTLNFDVYNTKHNKQENDPEKNKSGIGLNNVKQRLLLLYPDKHDLMIRETGKEFFVHLTIQLS